MVDPNSDLYPGLSPEQLRQARENLERYFELAFNIANQNLANKAAAIDIEVLADTMKERSNTNCKT
jgi:hypothetical protein